MNAITEILEDPDVLAHRVADWLTAAALARREPFAICLSGGSTPERLYRLLVEMPYRDRFPWALAHWFWGDERFVPADDPRSNYRMVREAMLEHVDVPASNIHPIPTGAGTPLDAARAYEEELKRFYGAPVLETRRPLFEVTLLGLGDDGHTASLFPGTSVLKNCHDWVAVVEGVQPEPRITLTYPVLESSRRTGFLITGESKAIVYQAFTRGEPGLPASRINPVGALHVFVDAAAAGKRRQ